MAERYSDDFKLKCVRLVLLEKFSIGEVAGTLVVGKRNLYKWLNEYKKGYLPEHTDSNSQRDSSPALKVQSEEQTEIAQRRLFEQQITIKSLRRQVRVLERIVNLYSRINTINPTKKNGHVEVNK